MNKRLLALNLICLALLAGLLVPGNPQQATETEALPEHDMVILADLDDPFATLADEIAEEENAMRVYTIADLYDLNVRYVIYVASPAYLDENALIALSTYFKVSGQYPAVGIITGSTLEQARALWQRSDAVQNSTAWIASAPDVGAKLKDSLLWDWSTTPPTAYPVTEDALIKALADVDYFYWARHVAATNWYWYEGDDVVENERLMSYEVPELKPVVIHTPSCRSFVPWEENSIAMSFVTQGAAAYVGHLYPPLSSGYSIGELDELPAMYTWPGVPLGAFVQAQNRADERAVYTQPWLFMLGDPRIAFEQDQPYTVEGNVVEGNARTITASWGGNGVLPLLIEGGADYDFVRVSTPYETVGAAGDSDATYNRSVQSFNWQRDKVVLVLNPAEDFTVELHKHEPLLWRPWATLRGAFEFLWGFSAPMQTAAGAVALGLLVLVAVIQLMRKQNLSALGRTVLAGAVWALVQLIWCYQFSGKVMIISYTISPPFGELALAFGGTTAVMALGLLRMANADKPIGKLLGLLISAAPSLLVLLLYTGAITLINSQGAMKSDPRVWSLNYMPVRLAAIVALVEITVALNALPFLRRAVQSQDTRVAE